MEHNNNHNHHNGSGNGFLLGVIVGVLITLLFTTKRGKVILKDILEKGIDKFANLEELMRETEEGYDDELEDAGDDFIPTEPVEKPEPEKSQKVEKKAEIAVQEPPAKEEMSQEPKEKPTGTVETAEEKIEETTSTKEAPKFLDERPTQKQASKEPEVKAEEENPKATRVKRLFRGLRKKS